MGAGKKGALRAAAQARFAMLAKNSAARPHTAGVLGEPLLKPTTSKQDGEQLRWLEGKAAGVSSTENFLKDLASLRGRGQRQQLLHQQVPDAEAHTDSSENLGADASAPGQTILQAGDKLDDMQQRLNERREAVFAEYVGPLALMEGSKAAPLAVTVDRFAGEWTPPGGFKVPSMLKVTRLSSDTAVPQAAYRAEQASRLREPEVGVEGLSLERALEGLNEEQIELNKERAALFEAAVGGNPLPAAAVMNEGPALLEWQGGELQPTVTAAAVSPPPSSGAVSRDSLQPAAKPAVDFVGRDFVDGARPHPPAVARRGKRESKDEPQEYGGADEAAGMRARFLDEQAPVHHENPRNKVSDLMKELNVHGVAAEASHTQDPYDPWEPKSGGSMQAKERKPAPAATTATALRARVEEGAARASHDETAAGSGKYATATKVFRAASAAYKAAARTWKDLEAKEAQAQAEQAKLDKSLGRRKPQPATTEPKLAPEAATAASAQPERAQPKHAVAAASKPQAAAATHAAPAAPAPKHRAATGSEDASAPRGVSGEGNGKGKGKGKGKGAARDEPAPPEEAAPSVEQAGKKGLPRYKAADAHADLDSFFDSLIAQRVAVGHDRFNAPRRRVHKALSARDAERQKQDALLQTADSRRVSAKELEEAEEQTTKHGEVFGYVGTELPTKTSADSLQEMNDFYDSLSK